MVVFFLHILLALHFYHLHKTCHSAARTPIHISQPRERAYVETDTSWVDFSS